MNQKAELFIDSRCELGEGPFWNPLLGRLFWFDILNQTLLSATPDGHLVDRITFKDKAAGAHSAAIRCCQATGEGIAMKG